METQTCRVCGVDHGPVSQATMEERLQRLELHVDAFSDVFSNVTKVAESVATVEKSLEDLTKGVSNRSERLATFDDRMSNLETQIVERSGYVSRLVGDLNDRATSMIAKVDALDALLTEKRRVIVKR